jgi:hypothetical protein
MAVSYRALNRFDDAIRCSQAALRINPRYAEAHNNLGVALKRKGQLDEAVSSYQETLRLKPDHADAASNLGNVRRAQGKFEEAMTWYDRALQHDPAHAEAHLNRALLKLLLGQWPEGWPEYEWRLKTKTFARVETDKSRWDGSPLAGRTLLLLAEQGLGDTLHFVRYVPMIQERGGRVIVQCQAALAKPLAGARGVDNIAVLGSALPHFDFYAPLMSLAGIFGTTPATIPGEVPYLEVDQKLVAQWRKELEESVPATAAQIRVGIAWQGSPGFADDQLRSIPLTQFGRLAGVGGVQLISLQKGQGTEQLRALAGRFQVHDLESRMGEANESFQSLAAMMKNIDLVISCDSAVAHLAGALAVPVWLALPLVPDWRWLLDRADTAWYPTMRLFRQTRYGIWDDVFERMSQQLGEVRDSGLFRRAIMS